MPQNNYSAITAWFTYIIDHSSLYWYASIHRYLCVLPYVPHNCPHTKPNPSPLFHSSILIVFSPSSIKHCASQWIKLAIYDVKVHICSWLKWYTYLGAKLKPAPSYSTESFPQMGKPGSNSRNISLARHQSNPGLDFDFSLINWCLIYIVSRAGKTLICIFGPRMCVKQNLLCKWNQVLS